MGKMIRHLCLQLDYTTFAQSKKNGNVWVNVPVLRLYILTQAGEQVFFAPCFFRQVRFDQRIVLGVPLHVGLFG